MCEYFEKISELEWYLSIKEMERYKQEITGTKEATGEEETVSLANFHEFWNAIRLPEEKDGIFHVYSPVNLNLYLPPGGDFEVPLGFFPVKPGFEIYRESETFVFSIQKMKGAARPQGYVAVISNLQPVPAILKLERNGEIAVGGFAGNEALGTRMKICLSEEITVPGAVRITFPGPTVYLKKKEYAQKMKERCYLSIECTGREIVFHIQYRLGETIKTLQDPILYTIHEEDTEEYTVSNPQNLPVPEHLFSGRYNRIIGNDPPIPKKKYPVPIQKNYFHMT